MADNTEFEEEEFTTQFNGGTLRRVLGLLKPHWKWVVGFLISIAITAFLDSIFTLLSKRMVDEAIIARNTAVLYQTVAMYGGLVIVQAGLVLGFIFMAGILGERVQYDLRKKLFNHLQELSFLLQPDAGRLDHVARHLRLGAHRAARDVGDARCGMGHH